MSNLPAVRQDQSIAVPDDEMARLLKQVEGYLKSGVLPECIKTPQQAVVIALQGRELGIPPMASLQNIFPIKGIPMLSARLTEALLKRAGYRIIPLVVSAELARARFISPHGDEFVYEVTWEEAVAGGWNKDRDGKEKFAWRNRKIMLWNRCMTQGAKMFASDALLLPPVDEDESMMVYDPEDAEFVSPEEAAHREALLQRDRSLPVSQPQNGRGRLFKSEEPGNGEASPAQVVDSEVCEAPPEETGPGSHWTKVAGERKAFLAFLKTHNLSEDDAKRLLASWMGRGKPLGLFSEFPHDRARAQRVLLGWLMCHRPADPETHWMTTNAGRKAAFWALMGQEGLDTEAVHERVPRTASFPGTFDELVDFVLHSKPEDRWQLALPGMEERVA